MAERTSQQLQERLARVEEELRQLRALIVKEAKPKQPWWERTAGIFKGNKAAERVARQIKKNRETDRAVTLATLEAEEGKARRKPGRSNNQG